MHYIKVLFYYIKIEENKRKNKNLIVSAAAKTDTVVISRIITEFLGEKDSHITEIPMNEQFCNSHSHHLKSELIRKERTIKAAKIF